MVVSYSEGRIFIIINLINNIWHPLSIWWTTSEQSKHNVRIWYYSVFNKVVQWHESGEVENVYIAYNLSYFSIYLPKFNKIGGNLTKFWPKQFCTVFLRHCVYIHFGQLYNCSIYNVIYRYVKQASGLRITDRFVLCWYLSHLVLTKDFLQSL